MSWTCLWKAWWRHSCPVHSRRTKPCKSKTWAEKQACTTGASKIEWCLVLCARPYNNEAALEGVTSLEVAPPGEYFIPPALHTWELGFWSPTQCQSGSCDLNFNSSLDGVTLPSRLQSLTFGATSTTASSECTCQTVSRDLFLTLSLNSTKTWSK